MLQCIKHDIDSEGLEMTKALETVIFLPESIL